MADQLPHSPGLSHAPLTYPDAVVYLFGRINYERVPTSKYSTNDFQLPRMSTLLERLGHPERKIPAVHITGTKGKGSTAVMTAAMLQAAGFKVGLFTSPHLVRFEERMTVNGELPSEAKIVELVEELRTLAADLESSEETCPTFFELSTALAWMVFQDAECDIVVLEVGLGGRLDTTNLCQPLVTVVTSISRDHMKLLGETLELIAREKAGIVKPGVPMLTGVDQPPVMEVIAEVCASKQAPLLRLGQEITIDRRQASNPVPGLGRWTIDVQTPSQTYRELPVPLAGEFQTRNAALAVAAVEMVSQRWPGCQASEVTSRQTASITVEQMRTGLAQVTWPLRLEVVRNSPLIVLDAAHNDASMKELCNAAAAMGAGRKTLIFGTSRDKEAAAMLAIAGETFDELIITRYTTNPRAWPVDELTELARSVVGIPVKACDTVRDALQMMHYECPSSDLICIAGSFFLAAEAREFLAGQKQD